MLNLNGYINNKPAEARKFAEIRSPETDKVIASVGLMDANQVEFAIKSSEKVFHLWKNVSLDIKKTILDKFIQNLLINKEMLANLLVDCVGKSYNDSLNEVLRTAEYIECTVEVYENEFYLPRVINKPEKWLNKKTGFFKREPLGVILAISPFNYPINLSIAKLAPALITGNVVIFKTAFQASPIGIKLMELLIESGLPPGVIQCIVAKGKDIGSMLTTDKRINMISFTGSTEVGKDILKNSSVGNIVLEMGGLDAAIVLEDADLDLAAKEIVRGAFSYSGQRCTAIKRVIADQKIADTLTEKILTLVERLTVGRAIDNANITALISKWTVDNAINIIDQAVASGAKLLTPIERRDNLLSPVIVTDVTPDMKIANSELFAPVLPIIKVTNVNEMIKINNTPNYGLQASVFTANYEKVLDMYGQLEVGTVNWNRSSSRGPDYFPFLGVKDSGVGTQGIVDSLLSMTRYKGLTIINEDISEPMMNKLTTK